MLCALRRSLLLSAATVLALVCALTMTVLPLLHGGDDSACDQYAAVHDSSRHHLGPDGTTPVVPQHCIICHWSQWARGIQNDAPGVAPAFVITPMASPGAGRLLAHSSSLSAARAPPLA